MMSGTIKSAIHLAKYSLVKPKAIPYFREVQRNQYLAHEELQVLNWERTKRLIEYAYEKTPFYKTRFDAIGLHPKDLKEPADFSSVPVLTRADVRNNFQDMVSRDARRRDLNLVTTGGSTGHPVRVYHQRSVVRAAMLWRMESWWGVGAGDDLATVYRDTGTTARQRLKANLLWWPAKHPILDAALITEASMRRFVRQVARVCPKLIHGYVGAMDHLARFILENSIDIPPPKAVWVTSSPLTAVQDKHIEAAFKAPVYDQYGCSEVFYLAAQCPAKKALHWFQDVRNIEFLDGESRSVPPGQIGNIAITDLENFYFPIIRYLVGDRGRAIEGTCPCGVTLPLMDKVRGRISDTIKLPDGTVVSGEYLTTIFDATPEAVKQFRVHQKADASIDVLVVPNESYGGHDAALAQVREMLQQKVGGQAPVRIVKTDEIPQTGGKLQFVISEVGQAR